MIRLATQDDLHSVVALNKLLMKGPRPEIFEYWSNEDFLEHGIRFNRVWVYTFRNMVVAAVYVHRWCESFDTAHQEIWTLAVDDKYQKRGYGRRLVDRIRNELTARKKESLHVYTMDKTYHVVGFYERLGFKVVEREDERVHLQMELG